MQSKLQELQSKLSEEEEEKSAIRVKFETAEKRLKDSDKLNQVIGAEEL